MLLLVRSFPDAGFSKDLVCYILNLLYTINVLIHLHFYVVMTVQCELDDVYAVHFFVLIYELKEIFTATERDKSFRINQPADLSTNQVGKLIMRHLKILLLHVFLLVLHLFS